MNMALPIQSFKNSFSTNSRLCYNIFSYYGSKYHFSSSASQTLDSESLKNTEFSKPVQSLSIQSVCEILSTINPQLSPNESVSVLKSLRMQTMFKNIEPNIYKNDKKFETLCHIFEHDCMSMKPGVLISGLRSLLEIGVPSNSSFVIRAEQCILNNIHLFSTFNLIVSLYFHHKFLETDLQKNVVSFLIQELCERISDITSTSELLMLMHFIHIFSEEDQKKIQLKVIELIPSLNSHEMCKAFSILAEKSNRNIYILNALSFHLRHKQELPDLKDILGTLYAFKKLNFIDLGLMAHLSRIFMNEISSVTQPSIISGLLTVCGHLKWKKIEMLNLCGEWIINNIQSCRPKEFISYILTVAVLNHNNPDVQKTVNVIYPLLRLENVKSSDVWLDVVWSLAILGIVNKEMLLNILSPVFYKPLISNSGFITTTNKLKLMNLKAVLKVHHPECIFGCNLYLEPENVLQNSDIENGRKHVIKILNNFVPNNKYLCTKQNTDMGIFVDAEFIFNSSMKPELLSKFGTLSKTSEHKPLPKGMHRIALLILFYKDFTLHQQSPTGYVELNKKLLSAQGYTVVTISFGELMKNGTEVKKAKYLLNEISQAIKKNN